MMNSDKTIMAQARGFPRGLSTFAYNTCAVLYNAQRLFSPPVFNYLYKN